MNTHTFIIATVAVDETARQGFCSQGGGVVPSVLPPRLIHG